MSAFSKCRTIKQILPVPLKARGFYEVLNDSMRDISPVIYFSECGAEKEYTRSLIFRKEEKTRMRTDAKRGEGGEKKGEESKGEERSSYVYRMRVEFYACLIWKWIAREYASMRQVEEAEKGNRHGRKRESERGRKEQVK